MTIGRQQVVREVFRERARLIAYAWSIVRDEHLAEDIFQEVAALAADKADEIQSREHLAGWGRQAARLRALHHLRSRRRDVTTFNSPLLDQLDEAWVEIESLDGGEMSHALRVCLGELTPNNRRIVELRYAEGCSGVEVAERLDRKATTVYQSLSRIHRFLAGCIRTRLAEEREHG